VSPARRDRRATAAVWQAGARTGEVRRREPRSHQPRSHQPRSHQPRSHQPRSHQPRSHQPQAKTGALRWGRRQGWEDVASGGNPGRK